MSEAPGARGTAFRWTTIVLGIALGFGTFALIGLVAAWFVGGDRETHRIHDLAWGALGGLLLALPMLVQSRRPGRRLALMQQIALATLAVAAAGVLGGDPIMLVALAIAGLLAWLHPARASLLSTGRLQPAMAAVAAAAAIPLVAYALGQSEVARACPPGGVDPHCEELHWTMMTALALAIPLTGLGAALRAPGWRVAALFTAGAALVLGASSLAFPDHASALDAGWAWAAVAGASGFAAVAEWAARRPAA